MSQFSTCIRNIVYQFVSQSPQVKAKETPALVVEGDKIFKEIIYDTVKSSLADSMTGVMNRVSVLSLN